VVEGEAFAPDVEERHPQEIRGFDWLLFSQAAQWRLSLTDRKVQISHR